MTNPFKDIEDEVYATGIGRKLKQVAEGDHVRVTTSETSFTGVVVQYFISDDEQSFVLRVTPDDYDSLPLSAGQVVIAANYDIGRGEWSQDCHQSYEDDEAGIVVDTDIVPGEPPGEQKRYGNVETERLGRVEDVEVV